MNMKILIPVLICCITALVAVLSGCVTVEPFVTEVLEDDEIDMSLRNEIHDLNAAIVAALQNGDSATFRSHFVMEYQEQDFPQKFREVFPHMSGLAGNKQFAGHRDYYCRSTGDAGHYTTIPKNDYDFRLFLEAVTGEMFVSLMDTPQEFHRYILGNVYVRQENGWGLYQSFLGSYTIADKNAVHWYEEARSYYEKGYLVPASFRMQLAYDCLYPAPYLKYEDEKAVDDLMEKLTDEANDKYTFPVTLASIDSSPILYYIDPQFVQGNIVPHIKYVTSHPLTDATALDTEAEAMSPVVQELFPGIAEDTPHLVFQAYSEPPTDPNKLYDAYTTVVEVD
jgi:hypothetical protein